ncbi:hypothetical protein [Phormidium sp. FACHB-1136]|uniref:hypothetical protein n=1 Tax=Phormidium sp. FACHB-1136 TaxID=2692848 RepID=UPI00168670BB|nr:hypothetical protein [Phormidium sp. FACHB-1136]MBD2428663.1 hypothetical protein [Phormidium sp. FACHB-1136]
MGEPKGSKYGALIKQAKQAPPDDQPTIEPENQISGQPDHQTTRPPAPDEKQVNLCVKVPESLRRHWAIQAKIQGVTMTAVMVEALTERFGKPDDQMTR